MTSKKETTVAVTAALAVGVAAFVGGIFFLKRNMFDDGRNATQSLGEKVEAVFDQWHRDALIEDDLAWAYREIEEMDALVSRNPHLETEKWRTPKSTEGEELYMFALRLGEAALEREKKLRRRMYAPRNKEGDKGRRTQR